MDNDLPEEDEEVSLALVQGLKDGAFPNLQDLRVYNYTAVLATDSSLMALARAMEEGASCGQTLTYVEVGEASDEVKLELQRVLPGVKIRHC